MATQPADLASIRKQRVAELLDAIAGRRTDMVSACLTEDAVWWVPQSAGERGIERPLRGRESVLGLLCGKSRYQVGTMRWEVHQLLHDEDLVVAHCTLTALTTGGASYRNHYALIYRFTGDLVVEAWEHTDTAYAFARFSA